MVDDADASGGIATIDDGSTSEAAATVLCDADVAALSKCAALALQSGFVVRSAYQNDRILSVTCGTLDVGSELQAVTHGRHDVFFYDDILRSQRCGEQRRYEGQSSHIRIPV
jgi:hypothetical protein